MDVIITPQFSSVQSLSHVRLCDPMNCSTPGLPAHHQLPEFTLTHKPTVIDKYMVLTATKDPGYAMSKVFVFVYFISTCSLVRRRRWHPTSVLLPGKSHGRRSLVGCSPWGREESDLTERLHFPFALSCIGEGNGNPLQCSCLENPRDKRAWWAAVYWVAQTRTRLKRLSSSSSRGAILPWQNDALLLFCRKSSGCGEAFFTFRRAYLCYI